MKLTGKVIRYQDNVDTDVIIPARYLNTADPRELAAHCMEDLDKTFIHRVQQGDIIVGGQNFGCGSSREHAPLALQASGIACVVAKSFARIFYRNAVNIGLPLVECNTDGIGEADEIEIDFDVGTLRNLTKGTETPFVPYPPFLQAILSSGGLMNAIREGKV